MFVVGVKLRQVGPIASASAAYCIVKLRRSRGEKRLQLQVVVTRPWCGPRVTFRSECEDDWVGVAPGPSDAQAGPPHEILLVCHPCPPFSGGEAHTRGQAPSLCGDGACSAGGRRFADTDETYSRDVVSWGKNRDIDGSESRFFQPLLSATTNGERREPERGGETFWGAVRASQGTRDATVNSRMGDITGWGRARNGVKPAEVCGRSEADPGVRPVSLPGRMQVGNGVPVPNLSDQFLGYRGN